MLIIPTAAAAVTITMTIILTAHEAVRTMASTGLVLLVVSTHPFIFYLSQYLKDIKDIKIYILLKDRNNGGLQKLFKVLNQDHQTRKWHE